MEPLPPIDHLKRLAGRLIDATATVAKDAEAATRAVRLLTEQAHRIADLAKGLDDIAERLERDLCAQGDTLSETRAELAVHRPAVRALERVPQHLTEIAAKIQRVAVQSKLLSLNARIEAARGGSEAKGFGAVATEMALLANGTQQATDEIGQSASAIFADVQAARAIVLSKDELIERHGLLIAVTRQAVVQQHEAVGCLRTVADDGATRVDEAASSLGRVAASAVAVKTLGVQIDRMIDTVLRM